MPSQSQTLKVPPTRLSRPSARDVPPDIVPGDRSSNVAQIAAGLRERQPNGPDVAYAAWAASTPPPVVVCQVARVSARSDDVAPVPSSPVIVDDVHGLRCSATRIRSHQICRTMASAAKTTGAVHTGHVRVAAGPCRRHCSPGAIGQGGRCGVAVGEARQNRIDAADDQVGNIRGRGRAGRGGIRLIVTSSGQCDQR